MNKNALKYYGVTIEMYRKWCEENGLKHYDKDSKRKYFEYLDKKEVEYLNEDSEIVKEDQNDIKD